MAKAIQEQGPISFAPETFSSGRWDGGRGTVVAEPPPRFEYRTIRGGKGDFIVVEAHLSIEDQESNVHDVKWQAGFGDAIVIRESSDPESEEAETGPSIFAREPGKQIRLRAQEEWSQFLASLQTQGYPSAKLNKGDLGVFVDLDADFVQFARKKDDKYPILVVGEVFGKEAARGGKGTAAAGKSAGKPAAAAKSSKKAADEEEEDNPYAGRDAEEVALELTLEAINASEDPTGEGTTTGDVSRYAYKKLKGDPKLRKEVMDLVGSDGSLKTSWFRMQDEFTYNKKTDSVVRA